MNEKDQKKEVSQEQPKEPAREEPQKPEDQLKPQPKEPPKKTKPTACEKCGKKLREKSWYYRNGKYFCNKRCWKSKDKNA